METSMEFTKETAIQFVIDVLIRNGFIEITENQFSGEHCYICIEDEYYKVSHYDKNFLEHMDWFSKDLDIYSLMGYLSWNDFIERGYSK